MSQEHRRIRADLFADALVSAGVIAMGDKIRRVVIDANAGSAVVMYIERFADERLLNVVTTLDGIEVQTGTAAAEHGDPGRIEHQ
jgi:hypothetical protein